MNFMSRRPMACHNSSPRSAVSKETLYGLTKIHMTHNDSSPCREPGKKRGADLANKLAGANQIYRVSDDSFKNTPSVVGHIWTHEIGALALSPYIGRHLFQFSLNFVTGFALFDRHLIRPGPQYILPLTCSAEPPFHRPESCSLA